MFRSMEDLLLLWAKGFSLPCVPQALGKRLPRNVKPLVAYVRSWFARLRFYSNEGGMLSVWTRYHKGRPGKNSTRQLSCFWRKAAPL